MESEDSDSYNESNMLSNHQIPDGDQPIDCDKMFAMCNCNGLLAKAVNNCRKSVDRIMENTRENNEKKEKLMRKGNKAFREYDYKKALSYYDKAIDSVRDSCVLYTNRAMTYLKLNKPKKALTDTNSALYWDPENLKALVYKAQSLYSLGKLEESNETIAKACQTHPSNVDTIKRIHKEWIRL